MCVIYLAFNITPEKVVWYSMVRPAGGKGDVPETRNESAQKHCPEDPHGNFCCVSSYSILLETQQNLLVRSSMHRNVSSMTSAFTGLCTTLCILKEIRTDDAMRTNFTPHCTFALCRGQWYSSCGLFGA